MIKKYFLVLCAIAFLTTSCLSIKTTSKRTTTAEKYVPANQELYNTIVALDKKFFDAYNTCDLETISDLISEDIEFFHDKGGLSTSKPDIVMALKNNICGKVTRTLINGSIEVYPINGYGAVQMGEHKFFNKLEPDAKSIPSKFITIWKNENGAWKMTRIVSTHKS